MAVIFVQVSSTYIILKTLKSFKTKETLTFQSFVDIAFVST